MNHREAEICTESTATATFTISQLRLCALLAGHQQVVVPQPLEQQRDRLLLLLLPLLAVAGSGAVLCDRLQRGVEHVHLRVNNVKL